MQGNRVSRSLDPIQMVVVEDITTSLVPAAQADPIPQTKTSKKKTRASNWIGRKAALMSRRRLRRQRLLSID
jgi:hypothetical protein